MADVIDLTTYTPDALHSPPIASNTLTRTKRPFNGSSDDDLQDHHSDNDEAREDDGDSTRYVMTGGGRRSQRKRVRSRSPQVPEQEEETMQERSASRTPETSSSHRSVGVPENITLASDIGETINQVLSRTERSPSVSPTEEPPIAVTAPEPSVDSPPTGLQPTASSSPADQPRAPLRTRRGNSGVLRLSSPNASADIGAQQPRSPRPFPSPAQTRVFNDTIEPLRHSPTTFMYHIPPQESPPSTSGLFPVYSPATLARSLQRPLPQLSTVGGETGAQAGYGFEATGGVSSFGLGLAHPDRRLVPNESSAGPRPRSLFSHPRSVADLEPLPEPPAMFMPSHSPITTPPAQSRDSIWEAARPVPGLEALEDAYRRMEGYGRSARPEDPLSFSQVLGTLWPRRDAPAQTDNTEAIRRELNTLEEDLSSSDAMDLDSLPSAHNSPRQQQHVLPSSIIDGPSRLTGPPASAPASLSLASGSPSGTREQERINRSWEEDGERRFITTGPALSPNRRSFSTRSWRPPSLIQPPVGTSTSPSIASSQPMINVADYDGSRSPHPAPFSDDDESDNFVPDMPRSMSQVGSLGILRRASAPSTRQSVPSLARAQSISDLSRHAAQQGRYRTPFSRHIASRGLDEGDSSASPPTESSDNRMDFDISPPRSPSLPNGELTPLARAAQARRRRLGQLDTASSGRAARASSRRSPMAARPEIPSERPTARTPTSATYHDSPASIPSSIPSESARSAASLASGSLQTLLSERLQRARDLGNDYYSITSPRSWDPATPGGSYDRPELSPLTPSHPLPAAPRLIPRTLSIGDQRIRTGYTPSVSRNNSVATQNGGLSPIPHSPSGVVGPDGRLVRSTLLGWGDYRPGTHSPLFRGGDLPSGESGTPSEIPTPNPVPWRGWTDQTHPVSPPIPTSNRSFSASVPGTMSPSLDDQLSPLSAHHRARPALSFLSMSPSSRIPHGLSGRPAALFREEVRQAVVHHANDTHTLSREAMQDEARRTMLERRSRRAPYGTGREVPRSTPSSQSPADQHRTEAGNAVRLDAALRQLGMRTRFDEPGRSVDDVSVGDSTRETRRRRFLEHSLGPSDDDEMDFESELMSWGRRRASPPPPLPPTPPLRSRYLTTQLADASRRLSSPRASLGEDEITRSSSDTRRRFSHQSPRSTTATASTSSPAPLSHRSGTPPPGFSQPRQNPALSPLDADTASNTFRQNMRRRAASPSPTRPGHRDSLMTEAFLRDADRRRERARMERQLSSDPDRQLSFAFDDDDPGAFFPGFRSSAIPPRTPGAPRPLAARLSRSSFDWDMATENMAMQDMMYRLSSTGLPAHIISLLPTLPYKDSKEAQKEERCPICLDDYGQDDTVMGIAECGHFFHKDCFQPWLKTSRTCPYCRQNINPKGGGSGNGRRGGPPPPQPPPPGSGNGGNGSSNSSVPRSRSISRWYESTAAQDPW
ncbi:hypothetical protein FRB95_004912 [Tulasnella sp. JGI-2019a]|nr:hypothetical protein FRB95_004912 [Tulasnella sp. JGI-2019a]